jgi:hypothetical protein
MSAPAPQPTHADVRRRVLGEAYAFALIVARRPDRDDHDTAASSRPDSAADQREQRETAPTPASTRDGLARDTRPGRARTGADQNVLG